MSDSDLTETTGVFEGTFFILGTFAGHTKATIKRLVEDNGGEISQRITSTERVICGGDVWGAGAKNSIDLRRVMNANTEAAEADLEINENGRVWILPLDYLYDSIKAGEMLRPELHDLEMVAEAERQMRAEALVAEKRANGGVGRYKRGERSGVERKARYEADIEAHDRAIEAEKKIEEEREKSTMEKFAEMERERLLNARKSAADLAGARRQMAGILNRNQGGTQASGSGSRTKPQQQQPQIINQVANRNRAAEAADRRAEAAVATQATSDKPKPPKTIFGMTDWSSISSASPKKLDSITIDSDSDDEPMKKIRKL